MFAAPFAALKRWFAALLRGLDWFLPPAVLSELPRAELFHARVIVSVGMVSTLIIATFYWSGIAQLTPANQVIFMILVVCSAISCFGIRITGSVRSTGVIVSLLYTFGIWAFALAEQVIFSPTFVWMPVGIIMSVYTSGLWWGIGITILDIAFVILHNYSFSRVGLVLPPLITWDQFRLMVLQDQTMAMMLTLVFALFYEISRKQGERDLLRAQEQASENARLAEIAEVAGGIAHEINNPLAIIHGSAEQLEHCAQQQLLDPQLLQTISGRITRTTLRLSRIVNLLLTLSRSSASNAEEVFSLDDLCGEIRAIYEDKMHSLGIDFAIRAPSSSARLRGQKGQIVQAILHLINNAVEAIENESNKYVRIEFLDQADHIEMSIIDSGRGVPAELERKVFQPFFSTKAQNKGTGLGLAVAAAIIRDHGGSLFVDRRYQDSRFTVRLKKTV